MIALFPLAEVMWTVMWFFLFAAWLLLLFHVVGDVFASRDLGGWAKASWLLFVLIFPYIGVLVYLIARGGKMAQHEAEAVVAADAATRAYIRDAAGGTGIANEIATLHSLRERGIITDADFEAMKAKVLQ